VTTYFGGGYRSSLPSMAVNTTRAQAVTRIKQLRDTKWIDRQTRAVFVDLTLYNPASDLREFLVCLCICMHVCMYKRGKERQRQRQRQRERERERERDRERGQSYMRTEAGSTHFVQEHPHTPAYTCIPEHASIHMHTRGRNMIYAHIPCRSLHGAPASRVSAFGGRAAGHLHTANSSGASVATRVWNFLHSSGELFLGHDCHVHNV
jgi:hypothetical protein